MLRSGFHVQQTLQNSAQSPGAKLLHSSRPICPTCLAQRYPARITNPLRFQRSKGHETRRKAPSSRIAKPRTSSRSHDAEGVYRHVRTTWMYSGIKRRLGDGFEKICCESIVNFYREFRFWARTKQPGTLLPQEKFEELMQKHRVAPKTEDIFNKPLNWLALSLLQYTERTDRDASTNLMYNMAVHGDVQALFRLLHISLEQVQPESLNGRHRVAHDLRSVLNRRFVDKWLDGDKMQFAAAVLEAKLRLFEGKHDSAVELLQKAVDDAVDVSVSMSSETTQGKRVLDSATAKAERWNEYLMSDHTDLDLTQPWITLLEIYQRRFHEKTHPHWDDTISQAKKYVQIGCDQDDPRAHWLASKLYKNPRQGSESARWLYHVTKAAASGAPEAATDLADYYLNSGWRYIEDDPPAHMRPTAFDKYPITGERPSESKWLRWFLRGLQSVFTSRPVPKEPWDDLYYLEAHPLTAEDRLNMAHHWLDMALSMEYLPAAIVMAKCFLTKTLWSQANAPEAAAGLKDDRYDYETEEDWKARHTPEIREKAEIKFAERQAVVPEDVTNQMFSIRKAEHFLSLVFQAQQGFLEHKTTLQASRRARQAGMAGTDHDETDETVRHNLVRKSLRGDSSFNMFRWLSAPDVARLYLHKLPAMIQEVEALCDEHELVLKREGRGAWYDYRWKRSGFSDMGQ